MARDRDPFSLAYSTLRERLQSGALGPGQAIVVLDVARTLGLSPTPIREALAKLCGEGLIDRGPGPGYAVLRMDASAARDRYALQHAYLSFAIDALPPLPAVSDHECLVSPSDEIFRRLIASTGNQSLVRAYQRLAEQVGLLKRAEQRVLGQDADLSDLMNLALRDGRWPDLGQAIGLHFERRRRAAGLITSALSQSPS